ncbi:glycine cleavage system protein R [Sphingomonas sp. GlSt437]|uniref:glycine cleavage system protein R n=1 Tax=Sphingomonas sp. GlSt437 TaxID=3389970 RepID=UPI003A8A2928
MPTTMILTALGTDRPGLTAALADAVTEAGGNWLESQLGRLGGKYVGAVLVEIGEGDVARLEAALAAIDPATLAVTLAPTAPHHPPAGHHLSLELVGADRPGIVREVTSVLAGLGVNIESLETAAEPGSWSGELLFRARAELLVPDGVDPDAVSTALEAISGEIMADITLSPGG